MIFHQKLVIFRVYVNLLEGNIRISSEYIDQWIGGKICGISGEDIFGQICASV